MKRIILVLTALSLIISACTAKPTQALTAAPTEVPQSTDTLNVSGTSLETKVSQPTEKPKNTHPPSVIKPPVIIGPPVDSDLPITNTTCGPLSFYLDPTLGSSVTCEIVPAKNEPQATYPQYTNATILGYPLTGNYFEPVIEVYPVSDYAALLPDLISSRVAELQNLVAGGAPTGTSYPFLPIFNAVQVFHSNFGLLSFMNGSGIRFLTQYAQYSAPINNNELFYTFQGLTEDGSYWVSITFPINHPILPANASTPPNGWTLEQLNANYDVYKTDIISQLEAQSSDSFIPSMVALDTLVKSIQVAP